MSVTIRRTIPDLATMQLVDRADMRAIGLLAIERIRRRTLAGRDVHGQAFEPYSPGYRERKARELGVSGVNLAVSGAMLNALGVVDVTDSSVTIGFTS